MQFALILLTFLLIVCGRSGTTAEPCSSIVEVVEETGCAEEPCEESDEDEWGSGEEEYPEYVCKFNLGGYCTFNGVQLNRSAPHWAAVSEDPTRKVDKVQFTNSRIEFLTSDLCDAFPDLEVVRLGELGLEEVEDDAFFSCDLLKNLRLESNQLKSLPDDLFLSNFNLTTLVLSSNKLTSFNISSLQNCKNLTFLDLENNHLTAFEVPGDAAEYLGNLQNLDINTNDISYLDEEALLEALPSLGRIWINQNEFACSRVETMLKSFKARNVKVETSLYLRKRFYEVDRVEGINCLPDVSWSANVFKKAKEQETDLRKIVREEVRSVLYDLFQSLMEESEEQ